MRQTREATARSRKAIVTQASHLMRRRGVDQTSVADVMAAADLTHGGFYRHFKSKDALAAAAIDAAFDELASFFDADAAASEAPAPLAHFIDMYLSDAHAAGRVSGCPIVALGVEAGRTGGESGQAVAAGMARMLATIETHVPGPRETRKETAMHILTTLIGSLVIARAAGDAQIGRDVLAASRARMKRELAALPAED